MLLSVGDRYVDVRSCTNEGFALVQKTLDTARQCADTAGIATNPGPETMTRKTRSAIFYAIGTLFLLASLGFIGFLFHASFSNPAAGHVALLAAVPMIIGLIFIGHADDVAQDLA